MFEPYYFNTLGYAGADDTIKNLLIAFTKRCREQSGAKFQLVIHRQRPGSTMKVLSPSLMT